MQGANLMCGGLQDALAGETGHPAGVAHTELVPVDLGAELPERHEVVDFHVGSHRVVLGKTEDVFDQVLLQADVVAGNGGANFLQHHLAVFYANHRGQARIFQSVANDIGVVRHGGGDLNTGAAENTVDGIDQRIAGIMKRSGVGRSNHTHARSTAAETSTDGGNQHGRIREASAPGLIPAVQRLIAFSDGGPQGIADATEELFAAAFGDESAVQAVDGGEDVAIGAAGQRLTQSVEGRVDLFFRLVGVFFHGFRQGIRDGIESSSVSQCRTDGGDVGRLVHLQNAAGFQGVEPGIIGRHRRKKRLELGLNGTGFRGGYGGSGRF